ncbi:MAG: hypothetical protein JST16_08110 [Bdellovibrionales bacterium]|nr:hypothetical protein [Bdellovibrionales bacterium]
MAYRQALRTFTATALVVSMSMGLNSREARAWGRDGHQIVARVAADLATDGAVFWQANKENLTTLTTAPDDHWKVGPDADKEKPNHWLQIDNYFANPQDQTQLATFPFGYQDAVQRYTEEFVTTNGTAMWRIKQLYDLAVEAFRSGDFERGLQMAGTMTHYTGDLSQPLHVSKNYDGEETGDKGIHMFFETKNITKQRPALETAAEQEAQALLTNTEFTAQFGGTLKQNLLNEVKRAFAEKDNVINTDKQMGRSGDGATALRLIAQHRLADGGATTALVLSAMWRDAGNPGTGATVKIDVPEWVVPEFNTQKDDFEAPISTPKKKKKRKSRQAVLSQLMEYTQRDDCDN